VVCPAGGGGKEDELVIGVKKVGGRAAVFRGGGGRAAWHGDRRSDCGRLGETERPVGEFVAVFSVVGASESWKRGSVAAFSGRTTAVFSQHSASSAALPVRIVLRSIGARTLDVACGHCRTHNRRARHKQDMSRKHAAGASPNGRSVETCRVDGLWMHA